MLFYAYLETDGDEHACVRDLLFSLVKKHMPHLSDVSLCHDTNGSPYLSHGGGERADGVFVSLSHSHGMCAAAISDTPVGVDVELIKERKTSDRIEARFIGKLSMPDGIGQKEHPFFYRWTYFEACYKATQKYDIPLPVQAHETLTSKKGERYVLCIVKK